MLMKKTLLILLASLFYNSTALIAVETSCEEVIQVADETNNAPGTQLEINTLSVPLYEAKESLKDNSKYVTVKIPKGFKTLGRLPAEGGLVILLEKKSQNKNQTTEENILIKVTPASENKEEEIKKIRKDSLEGYGIDRLSFYEESHLTNSLYSEATFIDGIKGIHHPDGTYNPNQETLAATRFFTSNLCNITISYVIIVLENSQREATLQQIRSFAQDCIVSNTKENIVANSPSDYPEVKE